MNSTCYVTLSTSEKTKQRARLLAPIKDTDLSSVYLAGKGLKIGEKKGTKITLPIISSMKLHPPSFDKSSFYRRGYSDPNILALQKRTFLPPLCVSRTAFTDEDELEAKISPLKPWSGGPSDRKDETGLY